MNRKFGPVLLPLLMMITTRHLRADLHAMESQDLFGGHRHFGRPAALGQAWSRIS